jgi:hypothetical protein
MAIRSINSPGVEIREVDKSQVSPAIVGSTAYVMGFANKGEAYEPIDVVSVADFTNNFGEPTNEAERYFYHTCKNILDEGGNLTVSKLPYQNNMDGNYKRFGLSISRDISGMANIDDLPDYNTLSAAYTDLSGFAAVSGLCEITIGAVADITNANYDDLATGSGTILSATYDFVVVNDRKNKITGINENEGIFVAVVDPIDGMLVQRIIAGTDNDPIKVITGFGTSTFTENVTGTFGGTSISETLMKYFPSIEFTAGGNDIDNSKNNYISLVVCKTVSDKNQDNKLSVIPLEVFAGSIYSDEKDPATGQTAYIVDLVNQGSQYISMYATGAELPVKDNRNILFADAKAIDFLSFTADESAPLITSSAVLTDIDLCFEKVSNINERQIDIVVDAGLSTIAQFMTTSGVFDPVYNDAGAITDSTDVATWRTVCGKLINFCQRVRKDCIAILDAPRNLTIESDKKFIRKTAPNNTFSNTIAKNLKYLTGLNSSYAALYTTWVRQVDSYSGLNVWLPLSSKAAGIYVRTDLTANMWDAPAGLNRGVITDINDISFNPTQKESDQVYMKSMNYAKQYPLDGFILEGQKTTQVKPSAFDRINVRRLFLRLERVTYQLARYFVHEPNNLFTRRRLFDSLNPIFQNVETRGGLYDYRIVVDERNNSPTVIDNNELRVSILIKPSKVCDYIIVDFISTRTDANFEELI